MTFSCRTKPAVHLPALLYRLRVIGDIIKLACCIRRKSKSKSRVSTTLPVVSPSLSVSEVSVDRTLKLDQIRTQLLSMPSSHFAQPREGSVAEEGEALQMPLYSSEGFVLKNTGQTIH